VPNSPSLTEWGLSLAAQRNLEVRAGNEGENGPMRGFALHVRAVPQGLVFRHDPEDRPKNLLFGLPALLATQPALASLFAGSSESEEFQPAPSRWPYQALAWRGGDRTRLEAVLLLLIAALAEQAVPLIEPTSRPR